MRLPFGGLLVVCVALAGVGGYLIGRDQGRDAGLAERVDPTRADSDRIGRLLRVHDDRTFIALEALCRMASHLPTFNGKGPVEPTDKCFGRDAPPTFDQHDVRNAHYTDVICSLVRPAVAPRYRHYCDVELPKLR